MYYEFYLDLYFLENFLINYLILRLSAVLLHRHPKRVWTALIAGAGAVISAALVLSPVRKCRILLAFLNIMSGGSMLLAVYSSTGEQHRNMKHPTPSLRPIRFERQMGRSGWETRGDVLRTGLLAASILGTLWQILYRILQGHFWLTIWTGYVIAYAVCSIRHRRKEAREFLYEVELYRGEQRVYIRGLLDSGNHLRQPGTGRAVQIIEMKELQGLLTDEEWRELDGMVHFSIVESPSGMFTYIPYHSIGRARGLMPLMKVDDMRIRHGEQAWNTGETLVAVTRTAISSGGEYQMILHPQILK
ncbi:MAG: sigma-E processing peptidase SpoIIGA [Eubacteriales bacterium]|nr:sigma-E processing peptidase SpoIIGA [Eubacteriales bacterium]